MAGEKKTARDRPMRSVSVSPAMTGAPQEGYFEEPTYSDMNNGAFTRQKILDAAIRLGKKANNQEIAEFAGLKSRRTVNYYFHSKKDLFFEIGTAFENPVEKLINAAKALPPKASAREIAEKAGYKSHKIINCYFASIRALKEASETFESNVDEISKVYPEVAFSEQDVSRGVQIPTEITPAVAEEIGWHIGDGSMPNNSTQHRTYQLSGDKSEEKEFYDLYVRKAFKKIYNTDLKIGYKSRKRAYGFTLSSKAVTDYKTKVIGLPIGEKSRTITIPPRIMNGDINIKRAVVRGIADTDFSFMFGKAHKKIHYYPRISGSTASPKLAYQLKTILTQLGLKPNVTHQIRKKKFLEYSVRMCGEAQLEKWMNKIGINNPKHMTKYLVWKKFGFCPPKTNIKQRKQLLMGLLDPYSLYGEKNA
ncbi:MAG: hypothetical protein J4215_00320 [Candidatus Diapherotrites archaeon]|uniref:DOD-type homing endonuclease domain-containing protein n=1 Tax=Candidatus Iainarchaeum sp. TaxID=3101447 RepID=A0A8T4L0Z9_9ARCH|nr:hypothetical protein [Candidatus Diapherotrites archaeon]